MRLATGGNHGLVPSSREHPASDADVARANFVPAIHGHRLVIAPTGLDGATLLPLMQGAIRADSGALVNAAGPAPDGGAGYDHHKQEFCALLVVGALAWMDWRRSAGCWAGTGGSNLRARADPVHRGAWRFLGNFGQ